MSDVLKHSCSSYLNVSGASQQSRQDVTGHLQSDRSPVQGACPGAFLEGIALFECMKVTTYQLIRRAHIRPLAAQGQGTCLRRL